MQLNLNKIERKNEKKRVSVFLPFYLEALARATLYPKAKRGEKRTKKTASTFLVAIEILDHVPLRFLCSIEHVCTIHTYPCRTFNRRLDRHTHIYMK